MGFPQDSSFCPEPTWWNGDERSDNRISPDVFCVLHGYDHMRCDQGPIPYCAACDEEARQAAGDE
jgi:hypothetical protein